MIEFKIMLTTISPFEMDEILSDEKNLGNTSCPLYATFYEGYRWPIIWPANVPDGWNLAFRIEIQEAWLTNDIPQTAKESNGLWFVGDTESIDWSQVSVGLENSFCASMDGGTPSWVCKCCFASNPGDADKCKTCGSSKPSISE